MKELVNLGHLVPLRYFAPTDFHSDDIKLDADGEYQSKQLDEYIDSKLKTHDGKLMLVGDVISNWQRIASDRQTVVFCKTQAHSRFVTNAFIEIGVDALYIDCNTPMEEREEIFEAIATKKAQVLVNVGIISMGIDIPILSCVILATPINKIARYLQCVGRLTRPHKESGKVDGIVIDHAGIVAKLGYADDEQYWSLVGKQTPEQLKKAAKEEKKEPKEVTCSECGSVFKSRRDCPVCKYEAIPAGEDIPYHAAELEEIKPDKIKPAEKQDFYSQLLYIAREKGYKRGWADHKFKEKFKHFPAKKTGIMPIPARKEVKGFLTFLNIKKSRVA
jgi:superfamily II DNA or RNA helicase